MFRIEWTTHEPKPQTQVDELYRELQESIAVDGPHEFATLVCAARLLETRHIVAKIVGYPDREPNLDYTDIVEFFDSADAALEALAAHHVGVIELYPGSDSAEYIVVDAAGDPVRLFRVPWLETTTLDTKDPLPHHITDHPMATRGRRDLADHFGGLRREFAQHAIEHDPRLAAHEPIRRWSRGERDSDRTAVELQVRVRRLLRVAQPQRPRGARLLRVGASGEHRRRHEFPGDESRTFRWTASIHGHGFHAHHASFTVSTARCAKTVALLNPASRPIATTGLPITILSPTGLGLKSAHVDVAKAIATETAPRFHDTALRLWEIAVNRRRVGVVCPTVMRQVFLLNSRGGAR